MMTDEKIIIVGSGVSALMLAKMIRQYKDTITPIIIIEKDEKIGGQFGSVDYGEYGYFDYGMHIYYESCIPEIDLLFTSLLPEDQWNILCDNQKDIAGIFLNGKLQTDTPYPDLRAVPENKIKEYIADLFLTIKANQQNRESDNGNAYEILNNHFGPAITQDVFVPILEKLYLNHPNQLDKIATQLTAINRIALFDEDLMLDLMKSSEMRARLCYPNQHTLPAYRTNGQRGFYPTEYGMFRVLEEFKLQLEAAGTTFLTATSITEMNILENRINTIKFAQADNNGAIENIKDVYWTAGLPPLAIALNINLSGLRNDKREPAYYINLVFDKNPRMDLLYYFYCFDKGYRTFRVTNYSNYCPKAADHRGFPICVEWWPTSGDSMQESDMIKMALGELAAFGVISDEYTLKFSRAEKVHGGGFPLPTLNNISNVDFIRDKVKERNIQNLTSIGVLSEKEVFFIKDVLMDAYKKITN